MSHYIVDASIVIQRFTQDSHTPHVKVLFQAMAQADTLVIPEFCLLECTNVLWKHVRFQGMPQATAESMVFDLISLPFIIYEATNFLEKALTLGLKHQLAVYDSLYLALAERLRYPFITDDERQAKAAAAEGIILKPITDFTP